MQGQHALHSSFADLQDVHIAWPIVFLLQHGMAMCHLSIVVLVKQNQAN